MTCAVIATDSGNSGAQKGRSYWFPDTSTTELGGINGGTYDVWDDVTSHLIADYYAGLTRWQISYISNTYFQAAKFQPKAPKITSETTDQTIYDFWKTAKDYRFENNDIVDVYRMQYSTTLNALEWANMPGRQLVGPAAALGGLAGGIATICTVAFSTLF